ncbi:MAG: hypothetical protein H6Q67_1495 [Firmicutes bacterium]|nr:hypothetical protein [Bacillota bacterium]
MSEAKKSYKVVTGKCRLSYVHLVSPQTDDNGKEKYSVAVLIPKSDKVTLKKIKDVIDAMKSDQKCQKIWGGKWNSEMKGALRDGDVKADEQPEYADHYFFNCSAANRKPKVVDKDLNEIIDPDEIYSGMYARVSVNFFAFNKGGGKGIGAGLNNVQKLAEGEPLGGYSSPETDFGDDGEDDLLG